MVYFPGYAAFSLYWFMHLYCKLFCLFFLSFLKKHDSIVIWWKSYVFQEYEDNNQPNINLPYVPKYVKGNVTNKNTATEWRPVWLFWYSILPLNILTFKCVNFSSSYYLDSCSVWLWSFSSRESGGRSCVRQARTRGGRVVLLSVK